MNILKRTLLVAMTVGITSSCTLNVIQVGEDPVRWETPTKTQKPAANIDSSEYCHRFVFPDTTTPPEFPDVPAHLRNDDEYVLELLIKYNTEVRDYLKNAESVISQAYDAYLESCH